MQFDADEGNRLADCLRANQSVIVNGITRLVHTRP